MADNPEPTQWSVVLSANESGAYTHQKVSSIEQLTSIIHGASGNALSIMPGAPLPLPRHRKQQAVVFADLTGLKTVLEDGRADQVIQVQSGMTVSELNALLAERHQWWPVEAAETATIMDVLHSGDGGCLEHGYGGPRDLVLGMSVVLGTGEAIKCGGRVVKNVSGYDIGKLFLGSRGWLGIIVSAHLRLYALPQTSITSGFQFPDLAAAYDGVVKLLHSGLPLSCLEVLSHSAAQQLIEHSDTDQLLPGFATSNHQGCAVLIRTQGMPEVANEVSDAARSLLANAKSAVLAGSDGQIWRHLSVIDGEAALVNCCAKDALLLIDLCRKASLDISWQWRPSKGKLYLAIKNKDDFSALLAGQRWKEPLLAGFASDTHHYKLTRYPHDQALSDLKLRLKQQYDPSGIMNPFVEL